MNLHCGLDFGTSNSVISVLKEDNDKNANNHNHQTLLTPSLLFFPEDDFNVTYFTGHKAREEYLSQNMQGRFIKSVKSILPRPSFSYTMINGKKFRAEDLVVLLMESLKQQMEEQFRTEINSVTLGRPVFFSEDPSEDRVAEDRLIASAKLAGFKEIRLQLEPIAAAYDYLATAKKEQTLIVGE